VNKLFKQSWNSPTLMTWGSFATRSLSLIVVLPLVLNRLNTAEISLWYLFSTVIGLQLLADMGFSPTFSRVIAYGMGGLSTFEIKDLPDYIKNEVQKFIVFRYIFCLKTIKFFCISSTIFL
jgi:hypothetical protein